MKALRMALKANMRMAMRMLIVHGVGSEDDHKKLFVKRRLRLKLTSVVVPPFVGILARL